MKTQTSKNIFELDSDDTPSISDDIPYPLPTRTSEAVMRGNIQYDLPLLADDLYPLERYFVSKKIHSTSGTQKWGYDITAMKYNSEDDKWYGGKSSYDSNNPKNEDRLVYGKRVYAMGSGRIIRGWRNAPENPRPFSTSLGDKDTQTGEDRKWLHPSYNEGRIGGGGNHLLVEEDDGSLILYAHAQPGTISSYLCPHNADLLSSPGATDEQKIPADQQSTIKGGDFLFLVGNSGHSKGPHLHVHKVIGSQPVQMKFRRGLSTSVIWNNGWNADINKWTRFSGQRIPDGPVLIWPPRRLSTEYARHKYPAAYYQRMFDHLSDSGYWLEWFDGYSVAGIPYLNFVWHPAKGRWRAFHLLTSLDYQRKFIEAKEDKYYPIHVESSLVNGIPRYSAIFIKNKAGSYKARHDKTFDEHMAILNESKRERLNPVNISVVSLDGNLRYTVLYRSENIGRWDVKSQIKDNDYQSLFNEKKQEGKFPSYVQAYKHSGKNFFSVIFSEKPIGDRKDRHGMNSQEYQANYNSFTSQGYLTRAVAGYDGALRNHRYIAIWRK